MGEALAEARSAMERGERPNAAVAVVDEAMVARAHDRVQETNDPTAHAVVVALREAARKLGAARLADATIFTTQEPCAMCVGALLESDVEALVFAVANAHDGAAGYGHPACTARSASASDQGRQRHPPGRGRSALRATRCSLSEPAKARRRADRARFGILTRGEVSEWLMVPLSKSGVRKHRGFESRPLRHCVRRSDGRWLRWRLCSSLTHLQVRSLRCSDAAFPATAIPANALPPTTLHLGPSVAQTSRRTAPVRQPPRRGRLVDYGAALEMRFGATRRGFESRPLRHILGGPGGSGPIALVRTAPGRRRGYPSGAVLGGELAVPCTCNPL